MIRIGMLGCDSSHTDAYSSLTNPSDGVLRQRASVVKLWGVDPEQAQSKAYSQGIPDVVGTPQEAVRDVDAVMVVNRYGDEHFDNAVIALEAGLPTFVDKPMTNDISEAVKLIDLAERRNVPLMACSPYRYADQVVKLQRRAAGDLGSVLTGVVVGPGYVDMQDTRSKHPYFYGIHLTEILVTLFGRGAEQVSTRTGPRADVANVRYPDGRTADVHFLKQGRDYYQAAVYGSQGWGELTITGEDDSFYVPNLERFLDMVETGVPPTPLSELLEPLAVLEAVQQSGRQGRSVHLSELLT